MVHNGDHVEAALGLTVRSGWAAGVLLVGPPAAPVVRDSRRIDLSDPAIPEARQPYHARFGTARTSGPELTRLVGSVRRFGRQSVVQAIREWTNGGCRVSGAGVIVGSVLDPARIANAHIRIHAQEGMLFREVAEAAVTASGLPCSVWRERDLYSLAANILRQPEESIRRAVAQLGAGIMAPWRVEQKAAAVGAWLVLAAHARHSPSPPLGDHR
jgi:hypothetical protein